MLAQWLPETPSLLPGYASHYIGAGAATINSKGLCLHISCPFDAVLLLSAWACSVSDCVQLSELCSIRAGCSEM